MQHGEELATDELRREEPDITEKLIAAMEGMLQMSEAQAKSITAISDAIADIRFALDRQGSSISELSGAVSELNTDQISEPVLSDIHAKIRNISEAWNIMLSSSSTLEEKLSLLAAKVDNISEDIAGLFQRVEGDIRQLSMALKESIEKGDARSDEFSEKLNAARVAAQRAAESAEEMREIAETNKQAIKGLRERAEGNAALIEANRKTIESMNENLDNAAREMDRRLARNEEIITSRIDYAVSSMSEKIDDATARTSSKLSEMHEAWHNIEVENFEEMEKINLILTQMQAKFERLEMLISELKPKRRAPAPRKPRKPAKRRARKPRPEGAVVDYRAIEDLIVNYVRENGRMTIESIMRHTGIGETTQRKILNQMVREGKLVKERQGKFVYYTVA